MLVTGWVVRGINCPVVLAEELLALLFGEARRITSGSAGSSVGCAVTRLSLRPAARRAPPHRPGRGRSDRDPAIRPNGQLRRWPSVPLRSAV